MNHGLKCKIIKLLGEKKTRKTLGLSAGQRVLRRRDTKGTSLKEKKIDKLDLIKIKLYVCKRLLRQWQASYREWDKVFANHKSTKDSYLEHTDRSQSPTVMKPTIESGNGKRYEETFKQRGYTDGKWTHKKMSTSLETGEMQMETPMSYHYTLIRMANIQTCDNTKCGKNAEKLDLIHLVQM